MSLLDSEGVCWQLVTAVSDATELPQVMVLPASAPAGAARLCARALVAGKSVITEAENLRQDEPLSWTQRSFPFHPRTFAAVEHGASGVQVRVGNSKAHSGQVIRMPIRLSDFWSARRVGKSYLAFEPENSCLVWHKQNTIAKRHVRRLVRETIRLAFHDLGLPYVYKWFWPEGKRSVFSLRGDLDGGPEANVERFLEAVDVRRDCVTLFVCGREYRDKLALLRTAIDSGVELGNHTYCHYVFPDRRSNRRNINATHRLLKQLDARPLGFATPAYFWHPSVYDSLVDDGYRYACCFGLDHDHLPYFPIVRGTQVSVLPNRFCCTGIRICRVDSAARASWCVSSWTKCYSIPMYGRANCGS
jgi:peptidoglycan/xylan/chitin deacetylase (PgdA/CDA1 family)